MQLLGIGLPPHDVFPQRQTSRHVRLAVGIELHARDQQKQSLIRTERMPRGVRGNVLTAKRFIETFHAARLREIGLLLGVRAGQRIEKCSQPAIILDQKFAHEIRRRPGIRGHQVPPAAFGPCPARHLHAATAHADLAAEEIQHRRRYHQFFGTHRLP